MQNSQLPVDLLHWALALLPIVVLLVLLVVMRWKAPQAGPMGMFTAAAVAVLGFATPWETIAVASAKGIWDADLVQRLAAVHLTTTTSIIRFHGFIQRVYTVLPRTQ
jgi:L-lactate permease